MGLAAWLVVLPAHAGSYLDRAGLLVAEAARESQALTRRVYDKEFARLVHDLAEGRLKAAGSMLVPKEVVQAHPHLLLILEHHERAAQAAVDGKAERFLVERARAQGEEQIFRSILRQLGWSLPEL